MTAFRERQFPLYDAPPPRAEAVRRMSCGCGCGRWYYVPRNVGRPYEYATRDCAERARYRRRVKRGEIRNPRRAA